MDGKIVYYTLSEIWEKAGRRPIAAVSKNGIKVTLLQIHGYKAICSNNLSEYDKQIIQLRCDKKEWDTYYYGR